ncbi:DUF1722 domain-containing protein [Streptococcus sp. X16XC17]|uniref:DUF1722 domain-containing protein n=1 Tax=unclassified Streptococcus TaxID=2608887 RepID=UPI00066FB6F8|nr:DUF1722 domain-containing protein [Streptococcus sp. X13SY08]TCD46785.1 DUF1722 domain-containing protein [Streptococcus sp. X16XC17]
MVNERLKAYQKKWAYEKYLVMAHSQQHYNALRQLFKGNIWIPEKESEFHRLVQKALAISPTTKTIRTAYQHVWGYFKKVATTEELETYKDLEASLEAKGQEMHDFLRDMTAKYQPSYLLGCHLMELKRLL